MKKFMKENLTLVLAFTLPFLVVVGVVISAKLPSLFFRSNYDFVYVVCMSEKGIPIAYGCERESVKVFDNQILYSQMIGKKMNEDKINFVGVAELKFYLHNVARNKSRPISLEEAQAYKIAAGTISPEGISFARKYEGGGGLLPFLPFFGHSSAYVYYLERDNTKMPLDLVVTDSYNNKDQMEFVGWVLHE